MFIIMVKISINMDLEYKQELSKKPREWMSVGASIRRNEIDIFNKQLDSLRCKTLKDLCSLLIAGKLRLVTDDEQVQIMKTQTQANGLLTAQLGDKFDFWKQIDNEDFHSWLLVRYHPHYAKSLHSYYVRYVDIFFNSNPDVELFKCTNHKRSWILQAIKRFGDYYVYKYGNKDVKHLISRIIERYDLNKGLDHKDRIYLVSPQFIEDKIAKVMNILGDIGFTCRIGLFSGLREDEIIYIRLRPICAQSFGCQCEKLHVSNCSNGLSVIAINWSRGNKKALATIIPTAFWERLRSMPKFDQYDIQAAHRILKREPDIAYMVLRKIHYNVLRFKNAIELDEAEVLAGRFKSISARHYVLNDPEKLSSRYVSAWRNFGVDVTMTNS
jgi:hypothetical protein